MEDIQASLLNLRIGRKPDIRVPQQRAGFVTPLPRQTLGVDRHPGPPIRRKNVEVMQISMQEHGRLTTQEQFAKQRLSRFHERPRKWPRPAFKSRSKATQATGPLRNRRK